MDFSVHYELPLDKGPVFIYMLMAGSLTKSQIPSGNLNLESWISNQISDFIWEWAPSDLCNPKRNVSSSTRCQPGIITTKTILRLGLFKGQWKEILCIRVTSSFNFVSGKRDNQVLYLGRGDSNCHNGAVLCSLATYWYWLWWLSGFAVTCLRFTPSTSQVWKIWAV